MAVCFLRKRILTSNCTMESLGDVITSILKPHTASSSLTDIGPQMSKHHHETDISSNASCATISKGKSEKTSKGSLLESSTEKQPTKSNIKVIKHPVIDSNNYCLLFLPQTNIPFCSSPANSIFSATHCNDAKQSFTESSECASSVDQSRESGEVSNSCDLFESRKTSTCSDPSNESSASGCSTVVYKPHEANDVRWEAVQVLRSCYGVLELKHFRMQLGCWSYLAELTGTDKAMLEGRKNLLRAQTRREILQWLDHPFLSTLYSHFGTDKAAFLVMEFCPSGDLHVLSQRQWGKYLSGQAARFYMAEILLALEYLHMLGIAYKDLNSDTLAKDLSVPPRVPKPFVVDLSRMGQNKAATGVSPSDTLAKDLIYEILLRLPLRSICRAKNVCKYWRSLIEGPEFIELYCNRLNSEGRLSLLAQLKVRMTDKKDLRIPFTFIVKDSPEARPRVREPIWLPANVQPHSITLLGSINGVVCFSTGINFARLALWNPTLGKHQIILPPPPQPDIEPDKSVCAGFSYDKKAHNYKIVRIVHSTKSTKTSVAHGQIFDTLSNVWTVKEITEFPVGPNIKGVMASNQLYWFCPMFGGSEKVIVFDACSEKFRIFTIPPPSIELPNWVLIALGNRIAVMLPRLATGTRYLDDSLESVLLRALKGFEKEQNEEQNEEQNLEVDNMTKRFPRHDEVNRVFGFSSTGEIIAVSSWGGNVLFLCSEQGSEEVAVFGSPADDVVHHLQTLAWPLKN